MLCLEPKVPAIRSEGCNQMMICKADFEDLFPDLFPPEPAPTMRQTSSSSGVEHVALWEGARDLILPVNHKRAVASGPSLQGGYGMRRLARSDALEAIRPVFLALAFPWTMFLGPAWMTTQNPSR